MDSSGSVEGRAGKVRRRSMSSEFDRALRDRSKRRSPDGVMNHGRAERTGTIYTRRGG